VWIDYCIEKNITYELIDWREFSAFKKMVLHDIVMWHYSHYSADEMLFASNILTALKAAGCRVFPDIFDSTHFDDKVAQAYLLKGLDINTPANYQLHSPVSVDTYIKEVSKFPVVAKLRTGSGSSNVVLLSSKGDLKKYSSKMFSGGINSSPNTLFKLKSNLKSTKSLKVFKSRLKRVPEFLFSRKNAKALPREKGYVYLQEFIDGVNYDLKIAIVGDKLSFVARGTRPGEFRASGGGTLFYDRNLIDRSIVEEAFNAYDKLQSDCTGLDMIKDPRTNNPVILEVSYGFSHEAQIDADGYYDRNFIWHDEPFNPPRELLKKIIKEVEIK
jgi:glutathione synthase/RimK-type ligase-like ATP-grasp enzyme